MRGTRSRNERRDGGAEAVEFAIVVPALLTLILALASFGLAFFAQISITQAAREGARYAAICQQDASCLSGLTARVQSRAPNISINSSNISLSPSGGCPTGTSGNPVPSVTVTVTYNYSLIPGFSAGTLSLKSKASAPCGG